MEDEARRVCQRRLRMPGSGVSQPPGGCALLIRTTQLELGSSSASSWSATSFQNSCLVRMPLGISALSACGILAKREYSEGGREAGGNFHISVLSFVHHVTTAHPSATLPVEDSYLRWTCLLNCLLAPSLVSTPPDPPDSYLSLPRRCHRVYATASPIPCVLLRDVLQFLNVSVHSCLLPATIRLNSRLLARGLCEFCASLKFLRQFRLFLVQSRRRCIPKCRSDIPG